MTPLLPLLASVSAALRGSSAFNRVHDISPETRAAFERARLAFSAPDVTIDSDMIVRDVAPAALSALHADTTSSAAGNNNTNDNDGWVDGEDGENGQQRDSTAQTGEFNVESFITTMRPRLEGALSGTGTTSALDAAAALARVALTDHAILDMLRVLPLSDLASSQNAQAQRQTPRDD